MSRYEDLIAGEDGLPATTGRAWVFGDGVSSAQILTEEHVGLPAEEACLHLLAPLNPGFAAAVRSGDFVVAGLDFGRDATRHALPRAFEKLGVAAIIARSFGPFFERNSVNAGLPALVVEETAAIRSGDRLRVDVETHVVANLSSGDRYVIRNLDDGRIAVLRAGGVDGTSRRAHGRD